MRYEGTIYRPPSEAYSLLIQATIGCPHNKCTFCGMYKGTKFRVRPVSEIKEDLLEAYHTYGPYVESVFFPDGNTIIMKTDQLVEILEYTRELFPYLDRITMYGSARFINKKKPEELRRLHEAGLNRLHAGMESGDDEVLRRLCKGATADEIIAAGVKLKEAGIQVSEYYLTGAGGVELYEQHALNSARVLNAIIPDFVRIRTLRVQKHTPLYEQEQQGLFTLPSPHLALRELRILVDNLNCAGTHVVSDHFQNYCNIEGIVPDDKPLMQLTIEKALTLDERFLRRPFDGRL